MINTWLQQAVFGYYEFDTVIKGHLVTYLDGEGAICLLHGQKIEEVARGVQICDCEGILVPKDMAKARNWLNDTGNVEAFLKQSFDLMKAQIECPEDLKMDFIFAAMNGKGLNVMLNYDHDEYVAEIRDFINDHTLQLSVIDTQEHMEVFRKQLKELYLGVGNIALSRYNSYLKSSKKLYAILENTYGPNYLSVIMSLQNK